LTRAILALFLLPSLLHTAHPPGGRSAAQSLRLRGISASPELHRHFDTRHPGAISSSFSIAHCPPSRWAFGGAKPSASRNFRLT
jgi:hypothetical protein